jgi:23S rRNA (cytosine1962-C5)-methyltransferase
MGTVRLRSGHVQPVWAGHPWVYAQAVDTVTGGATRGDEVEVVDPRGNFLGRGFYSPGSAIVVRILLRDPHTPLDASLIRSRIERAHRVRGMLGLIAERTTGYRLIHAEGDDLPGLIVDRFGDALVVQFLTAGMKLRESVVLSALMEVLRPSAIVDRTPDKIAKLEAFAPSSGVIRGDELCFTERGFAYRVPDELGQKTGFYFDQRGLRARVEELARGQRVLDAYSYIGAFSLAALRGGASEVHAVDQSAIALKVAEECARANGFAGKVHATCEDAREYLKNARASFDLTLLDPPRLSPTRSARDHALEAYARLAALGCAATKPGGTLVISSCSGAVDIHALTRALALGAQKANRAAYVTERHFQGADHPVPAAFGEGLYLKAVIARIESR